MYAQASSPAPFLVDFIPGRGFWEIVFFRKCPRACACFCPAVRRASLDYIAPKVAGCKKRRISFWTLFGFQSARWLSRREVGTKNVAVRQASVDFSLPKVAGSKKRRIPGFRRRIGRFVSAERGGRKTCAASCGRFFLKLALKNYFSEPPSANKIHQKSGSEKHLRTPAALFYFIS